MYYVLCPYTLVQTNTSEIERTGCKTALSDITEALDDAADSTQYIGRDEREVWDERLALRQGNWSSDKVCRL